MRKVRKKMIWRFLLLSGLILGIALSGLRLPNPKVVFASAPVYEISLWVVAGGGSALQNGAYQFSGTIGQHDAGPDLQNGTYHLSGGFWQAAFPNWQTHIPVIMK
ncbi:MAG: hypothetical protein PHQ40_09140 [Anaerolineaceae bacterium]|nr:hypothetical protein [Anaerolineaceae bacterium]